MNDQYLWDGSGEPDAEIQKLESVLARFRHQRPAPEFPERAIRPVPRRLGLAFLRWASAAALGAMVIVAVWVARNHTKKSGPPSSSAMGEQASWQVTRLAGSPTIGGTPVISLGRLSVGQWLATDSTSRAELQVDGIGEVQLDPETRVRLLSTSSNKHGLQLTRGKIHAAIWAPPGQFYVETPSAVAVDLGCAYTLEVDNSGAGLLRTTLGWVGFRWKDRESFIPAGAVCSTRPELGPGTPHFEDAPPKLVVALAALDFENTSPARRTAALNTVLTVARKRDALTLWHLLGRVDIAERPSVYARLARLVPPPDGVSREGILRLDKSMLGLWWDQLGLGDTSLWRTFERSWPQPLR